MSEEEEEVQDQKQTIDAKCQARTQRALWKRTTSRHAGHLCALQATLACATMLVEYEACQARIEAKVRASRPQSPAVAAHPLTGRVPCRGADRARGSMAIGCTVWTRARQSRSSPSSSDGVLRRLGAGIAWCLEV